MDSSEPFTNANCARYPKLPLELWEMIFGYLTLGSHNRQLSSLALVSRALYHRLNPLLYESVILRRNDENDLLVRTLAERPDLRALVREVRHDHNTGFRVYDKRSRGLYEVLLKLPALESVVMRMRSSQLPTGHPFLQSPPSSAQESPLKPKNIALKGLGEEDFRTDDGKRIIPKAHRFWVPVREQSLFTSVHFSNEPLFSALRSCHIGSDYMTEWGQTGYVIFDQSLFTLPQLEKLCITNGHFIYLQRSVDDNVFDYSVFEYTTALKELTLLNCWTDDPNLFSMFRLPRALKKITLRGPPGPVDPDFPMLAYLLGRFEDISFEAKQPIESMDLDVYFSPEGISRMATSLKHLTVTPDTVTGLDGTGDFFQRFQFPEGLETLTIRHQEEQPHFVIPHVRNILRLGGLPNLRKFTYLVPETMKDDCLEIPAFQDYTEEFKSFNVDYSIYTVPYPDKMPPYRTCSCERMEAYHRYPVHDPSLKVQEIEISA